MKFRPILACALMTVVLLSPAIGAGADTREVKTLAVITGDAYMGRFNSPSALFYDTAKKRLYVADTGNSRLVSLDSNFEYHAELSHEMFSLPTSLVKAGDGLFYAVDAGKAVIFRVDVTNRAVEPFIIKGLVGGKDGFVPGRLSIDTEGRIYVTDRIGGGIIVVDRDASFVREITVKGEGFYGFTDVRIGPEGLVYAIDTIGRTVYVFSPDGSLESSFSPVSIETGKLRFPTSIAVDKSGLIYVLDRHAGKILVFARSGAYQYSIGTPGVKEGQLDNPSYLLIDDEDRLYTIDGGRIQVFKQSTQPIVAK